MGKRFTLESIIRLETMLRHPNTGLLVQESDAKRISRISKALSLMLQVFGVRLRINALLMIVIMHILHMLNH